MIVYLEKVGQSVPLVSEPICFSNDYIFVARKMVYVNNVELFFREVPNYVEAKQCDLEGLADQLLELVYQKCECWLMGEILV